MKNDNAINLPEGITSEMIEKWKQEHGEKNIVIATLLDEKDEPIKKIILRRPSRQAVSQWEKFISSEPSKAKEILLRACLLTDQDKGEVIANDDLYYPAYRAVESLIPLRKAIVETL